MATIREWLDQEGFDWHNGTIVYHATDKDSNPGWSYDVEAREIIPHDHPILDKAFDSGYGGPECPRFIAFDSGFIYFPRQYDGSTAVTRISVRPEYYLEEDSYTPYPGG